MLKRSMVSSVLLALSSGIALAQSTPTVADLLSSAKALADNDWRGVYLSVCIPEGGTPVIPTVNPANFPTTTLPTPPGGTPPRANWYAPPAKIGDNLYFLGTREHNSYALVSKDGEIILIDNLFGYATPDEILTGLQKVGLDPYKVRYLLIAHEHGDHDGGAHLIEEAIPGVTIVYGEGAWPSVLNRTGPHATRFGPRNDGTDGRVITVGDVSVKIVTMPGHTPGTLSFLFEFKDKGKPIRVAYPGGTSFPFNTTADVLRPVHRRHAKVRSGGSRFRSERADIKSQHLRQCLLQVAHCAGFSGAVRRPPSARPWLSRSWTGPRQRR